MPQKRKQKGKGRPLSVPSLNNKPRYETPDPVQLPTPGTTQQVKLPLHFSDSIGSIEGRVCRAKAGVRMEMEEVMEEESTQSSCEEGMSGPWVKKGNPIGFILYMRWQ